MFGVRAAVSSGRHGSALGSCSTLRCRCAGKLELMRHSVADVIGLDWAVDMRDARATLGPNVRVQVRPAEGGERPGQQQGPPYEPLSASRPSRVPGPCLCTAGQCGPHGAVRP
jgi:hypothetical protein